MTSPTDGPAEDDGASQRRLGSLFVEVTGTDELTERRSVPADSHRVEEDGAAAIAEYVTAVAKDDGLGDAIPESSADGGFD